MSRWNVVARLLQVLPGTRRQAVWIFYQHYIYLFIAREGLVRLGTKSVEHRCPTRSPLLMFKKYIQNLAEVEPADKCGRGRGGQQLIK